MATTPTYINQRINNLQAQINDITTSGVPTTSVLAQVLANGNSAGANGINMNFNDVTNVNQILLDSGAGDSLLLDSSNLNFTGSTTAVNINNDNSQNIDISASGTLNLTGANGNGNFSALNDINIQSNGAGRINLDAPNMNSYGWAMPICLNAFLEGGLFYTLGSQSFEDVLISNPLPIISLPTQFFADSPQGGYTSTRWEINFDMNIYNGNNLNDKAFAIYILFNDGLGNIYTPFLYNQNTPFARWSNPSTFSGGGAPPYMSVNWCDWVDFNQLVGTFDSNINLQIWVAGDNPISGDFRLKLGFTRINRL